MILSFLNDLFAILDLPQGSFIGTGVKTVVLFFEKGKPSKNIWYYQLDAGRSLGKTNPLNEDDLKDFVKKSKNQEEDKNSWILDTDKINTETFDLTVSNPNIVEVIDKRTPHEIIEEIEQLNLKESEVLQKIKELM